MHPSGPGDEPSVVRPPGGDDGAPGWAPPAGPGSVGILDRLRDPAAHRAGSGGSGAGSGDGDERPDRSDVVPIGERPPVERPVSPRRFTPPAPPTDALRGWIVTLALTLVGAVVRFWGLGAHTDAGTPIFDEKYYALNAAEMLRLGGIEENPAFGVVVHPPLGKDLIAIGEWLFGYNSFGWRFASAVAGTICILLIVRVGRRLTGSTLLGGVAGVLLICDGVSHVNARVALLDVFQELFVLAAFACLIADRAQVRQRLATARDRPDDIPGVGTKLGIKLGARWYRFGAGLLLGLATSVKWSGIYWIAFFGVMSVVWDIMARREAGVRRPVVGVLRRDLLPSLWSYLVIGIGTYIGSWWAWFASESAWPRHNFVADTQTWKSPTLHSLAELWHNTLWQWTWKMLEFHSTLLTPSNPSERHPWESKPWTWPMGTRPVLYFLRDDVPGCGGGAQNCVQRIFLIGTPMLWWISLFVAGWALWRAIGRMDWRYMAVLVGYSAGYLPWFVNLNRQMYFFYATPFAPFLVLGIVLVLGDILGSRRFGVERRLLSIGVVAVYVGLVVANFIWLWPILNGDPITRAHLQMETWLPSWG